MKKKLLSEAQVRRFMGLAGLNPLNEMATYMEEEEEMEEVRRAKREAMHDEKKMENLYEEEEEMDMEAGDADLDIDEQEIKTFKKAADTVAEMAAKLAGAAGDEMDNMDMDDKEEEDMDMDDKEEDDMGMDEELLEVDMELTEAEKENQMEEIVNEVARRVAKRIVEAKRAHKKMNEALGRKK